MDQLRSSTLARCWIFLAVVAFAQQISASDHFMAVGDGSTVVDHSQDDGESLAAEADSAPCHGAAKKASSQLDPGQDAPSRNMAIDDVSSSSIEASDSCCESGCLMGTCHASSAALFAVSLFSADSVSDFSYSPIVASRIERSTSLFRPPIFS